MAASALSVDIERAALALFEAALAHEPGEREDWLARQCGADAALHTRLQALIAADAASSTALVAPVGSTRPSAVPATAILPPPQIGPYALEELIGSGGMGSVYRARRNDGLFEQTVAIKFMRPLRGGVQALPLVDAERRLLARMEHPAIAHILDGGCTANGLHFLVMEFVSGEALDEYAHARGLGARARVALLREVCAAVAHAHEHLVLHCDIKPANILVTEDGRTKLIDFGVARIQDVIDAVLPHGFTRAYTSPQRLAGEPAVVTDDVYSLGVVLRELLGGSPPGSAAEGAAPPAYELEAVARKALAPEREARYPSVAAFDDELRCWLELRPVAAMGRHWRYLAGTLMRRHPRRVAFVTLTLAGLVTALVVISSLYTRAETARRDAEKRFADVRALANYMLFDLDARLEATPGTTAARRELVERSQQYLDALAVTAGDNPQLQREVAVGLTRLAEIQGGWSLPNVGEPEKARRAFERAEGLLADLVQRRPAEWSWQRDLGRVQYRLADFYGGRDNDASRQLAKAREAEGHIVLAIDSAARNGITNSEQAELDTLLSSARISQAFALDWNSESRAAAAVAEKEEARLPALPEGVRNEMEFEYRAGRAAMQLGDSRFYLDQFEASLAAYRRALERYARALVATPRHRRLLDGSAVGHWSASAALTELGRHTEALTEIDLALPIGAQLLALDAGNVNARRMLSTLRSHRALILGRLARYDQAIALAEDDLRERTLRAMQTPDDAEPVRDAAVPLHGLAELYWKRGNVAAACAASRRAVLAWTAVEKRWGLSALDRRQNLEAVQAAAGRCPG
jgi:eukaryotic-like serine/threonine-protein kinase